MEQIRNNPIIRIAAGALVLLAIVSVLVLRLELNDLKEQRDTLNCSIAEIENRIEDMRKALVTGPDDAYIIKLAKEKLNLRLSEEIIFYNDITD